MELHLNHEQIKEYLTILDKLINAHYDSYDRLFNLGCDARRIATMQQGQAIGLATARDILFMLDQILERKEEGEYYYLDNLPRFNLEQFLQNEKDNNK